MGHEIHHVHVSSFEDLASGAGPAHACGVLSVVGATLVGLTSVLLIAAVVVLVHGVRRPRTGPLPTSITGPVLGLSVLALITGIYGFITLLGATFGIGVATDLG